MTTDDIKAWQTELKNAGYYTGNIDGLWGPLSQKAYDAYAAAQGGVQDTTQNVQQALGNLGIIPKYSTDWSDADVRIFSTNFLQPLGIPPRVAFTVMANESNDSSSALNKSGGAAGLFQLMPDNQRAEGFQGTPAQFAALGVQKQVPYFLRFFQSKAGQLGNIAAMYMATFVPAFLSHATDPNWVIAVKGGRDNGPWGAKGKQQEANAWTYNQFDRDPTTGVRRGYIIVQDLEDTAIRQARAHQARVDELTARAEQVLGGDAIAVGGLQMTKTQRSGVIGTGIAIGAGFAAYHLLKRWL
jgi:hypothetical protein